MSRTANEDTLFKSSDWYPITIPGNGGNGTDVRTLLAANFGASDPDFFKSIVMWEIAENAAAFDIARDAAMTNVLPRTILAGINLKTGTEDMDKNFVRSQTGATVAAFILLKLSQAKIRWD